MCHCDPSVARDPQAERSGKPSAAQRSGGGRVEGSPTLHNQSNSTFLTFLTNKKTKIK